MQRHVKTWSWLLIALVAGTIAVPQGYAGDNRIGFGANYWRTVDKLHHEFDRDGLSWLVSYQRNLSRLVGVQADVEWFRSGFAGSDKDVFAPQAFLLVGGALYAGLGVGILYSDGDFNDAPYYAVRLGLDFEMLPTIHLDINANYQFSEWTTINRLDKELSSDTIFIGGAVRIEF